MLVMLSSTEVSMNISAETIKTSLLALCNHRQKGKILLRSKVYWNLSDLLQKVRSSTFRCTTYAEQLDKLNTYQQGARKRFWMESLCRQIPSTWVWPLLFLNNHDIILCPLQDTSWGIQRVKLLYSLLLDFSGGGSEENRQNRYAKSKRQQMIIY